MISRRAFYLGPNQSRLQPCQAPRSFEEASTVFGDPLSETFPDTDHSREEHRFIIIGASERGTILVVSHTDDGALVRIIVHARQRPGSEEPMKKIESQEDELRPEYDFSRMKGGVRGKYVERYRQGTNLVLLDPDVAAAFPDAKAVNEALRLLLESRNRSLPR